MSAPWEAWEAYVNDLLGLDATPASGARWHAPGNGVDNDRDKVFPLIADAKYTQRQSYSITQRAWRQWQARAEEIGKRPIIPIRIAGCSGPPVDVVVIGTDDFAELLELARRGVGAPSGGLVSDHCDDISRIALGERE